MTPNNKLFELLDEPILELSHSDYLKLRNIVGGTLITGAPGAFVKLHLAHFDTFIWPPRGN